MRLIASLSFSSEQTIETLKKSEYIKVEKKAVYTTEIGLKLNKMLKTYFDGFFLTDLKVWGYI